MLDFSPTSPTNSFRAKRFRLFRDLVDAVVQAKPAGEVCRIVDVGGTVDYWEVFGSELPWDRLSVTVTNRVAIASSSERINTQVVDARDMSEFEDNSFDIVHSNSVIEHVGGWREMMAMAAEVGRLAPAYFVQTPYVWFPIEPHARTPFLQFLPEPLRYRLFLMRRNGYYPKARDVSHAMLLMQDARLLDRTQMRALFPDAALRVERAFGLIKSLIAIRHP